LEIGAQSTIPQRQAGMNKKKNSRAEVQIRRTKEECVDVIPVIHSRQFGLPEPEYYRKQVGPDTKETRIHTFFVSGEQIALLP
jgi:hypothetical protein